MSARRAERRQHLIARIAVERRELAVSIEHWRQPLAMIDLACSLMRFVRLHPLATGCGLAVLRVLLPRAGLWWQRGRQLAMLFMRGLG